MEMRTIHCIAFILVLSFLVAGCGNDGDGGIVDPLITGGLSLENLVGTWNAVKWEYVSQSDPNVRFDFVTQGGVTVTLKIQSDGRFSLTYEGPGGQYTDYGALSVENNRLIIDFDEDDQIVLDATLEGDTLTLKTNDLFDFDGDGDEEPATLTIVFERQ